MQRIINTFLTSNYFFKSKIGCSVRAFSSSNFAFGRKSREPYDRRFGIHQKDARPNQPGGSRDLMLKISQQGCMPQTPGYFTKQGKFIMVQEMIPEFVVPDLKDFELKPYVSYRVPDITQSQFTARDLFDATYAKPIVEDFTAGKIDNETTKRLISSIKSNVEN